MPIALIRPISLVLSKTERDSVLVIPKSATKIDIDRNPYITFKSNWIWLLASSTRPSSSLISTPGYSSTIALIFSSNSGVFLSTLKYSSVSKDSSEKKELFSSKTKNSAGGCVVQSNM